MYKHVYRVLIALTLFAVLMVPATQAQSIILQAEIPFDFAVGNKWLPAGEYQVTKPNSHGVILIQSQDARSSALAMTIGGQAGKTGHVGKLVFNRYGEQYFLSKIWAPWVRHRSRTEQVPPRARSGRPEQGETCCHSGGCCQSCQISRRQCVVGRQRRCLPIPGFVT